MDAGKTRTDSAQDHKQGERDQSKNGQGNHHQENGDEFLPERGVLSRFFFRTIHIQNHLSTGSSKEPFYRILLGNAKMDLSAPVAFPSPFPEFSTGNSVQINLNGGFNSIGG
jgi:hypothetical protein